MKIYILDVPCKSRDQMTVWLSDEKTVELVQVYEDYKEFIEHVREAPPDSCIIRLGKTEIPGFMTTRLIQQISSDIRIIFLSDDKDYVMEAYEVGAYGYLLCPLDKEKFDKYIIKKSI